MEPEKHQPFVFSRLSVFVGRIAVLTCATNPIACPVGYSARPHPDDIACSGSGTRGWGCVVEDCCHAGAVSLSVSFFLTLCRLFSSFLPLYIRFGWQPASALCCSVGLFLSIGQSVGSMSLLGAFCDGGCGNTFRRRLFFLCFVCLRSSSLCSLFTGLSPFLS